MHTAAGSGCGATECPVVPAFLRLRGEVGDVENPASFAAGRSCSRIVPSTPAISSASSSLIGAAASAPSSSIGSSSSGSGLCVEGFDIALTITFGWETSREDGDDTLSMRGVQPRLLDLGGEPGAAGDERVPIRKEPECSRVPGTELDGTGAGRPHAWQDRFRPLATRAYQV